MHNNGDLISVTGVSGRTYQYVYKDDAPAGGMKTVYFAADKSYAVGIYHKPQSKLSVARLKEIVAGYRKVIFDGPGKDYWEKVFCWPTDVIDDGTQVGLVMPIYPAKYFFQHDGKPFGKAGRMEKLKGREKNSVYFFQPIYRFAKINEQEAGDWHNYLGICLMLARGVRRLHFAGLAHSDLSNNNVLVDPASSSAVIIDIDGLVVPGKYPPDVAGTKGYAAPEVMETLALPEGDPQKMLPRQETDLHALAVLIYSYLLCRHPLDGSVFFNDVPADPIAQDALKYGSRAIFVEHPTDQSNRYDSQWALRNTNPKSHPYIFPWMDLQKLPYSVLGPYLKELFDKAFVDGLHDPSKRPHADKWESAITKTIDLLVKCENPKCTQRWMVYDPSKKHQICPFCGHEHKSSFPVFHLHRKFKGSYVPEKTMVVGHNGKRLCTWHSRIGVAWSEQNTAEEKQPLAVVGIHQNQWILINQRSADMKLVADGKRIPVGGYVVLKDGMEIRLEDDGSRMVKVEIANV